MKTVIIGPQQSGQQLFSLLTGIPLETIQLKPLEVHPGICEVKDPRVTKLSEMYNPEKTTYARIEYLLLPDFTLQGPVRELIFKQLKNADEICWVARDQAEVNDFVSELVIQDLILVEKRIENIEKGQQRKFLAQNEKEKEFLLRCKAQLDQSKPLQFMQFSDEQLKMARPYQFLSLKPLVMVVNVAEDAFGDKTSGPDAAFPSIRISAELEAEIGRLDEADQAVFMREMGIDEPALHKMTRLAYAGLGLISFFTVGKDEVRAWPVRRGATAAEAGSVIHSDIEKGFVRAELMKYDELVAAGSEARLREQGKFHLKGRDYVVEDGDILSFRFNI